MRAALNKFAWWLYQYTGIDLIKFYGLVMVIRSYWHRPFNKLRLSGFGAEIGVYMGLNARELLKRNPGIVRLYLCDGYRAYEGDGLGEQRLLDAAMKSSRRLLKKVDLLGMRYQWVYFNSPQCVQYLPKKLDFVYIDGNHSYESVECDIRMLWPLVKSGGYFGGHDFTDGFPGVIRAVTEFAVENKLRLHVEQPDWWVEKP